jgi:hypothetical protein
MYTRVEVYMIITPTRPINPNLNPNSNLTIHERAHSHDQNQRSWLPQLGHLQADVFYIRHDHITHWYLLLYKRLCIQGCVFFLFSFYFFRSTLHYIHLLMMAGNATYAGGLAALMANVVLIGYVVMAFMDDQAEQAEEAEKSKKTS